MIVCACEQTEKKYPEINETDASNIATEIDSNFQVNKIEIYKQHTNFENSIIYKVYQGFDENELNNFYAVPIFIIVNNKYIDPPTCEFGAESQYAIDECTMAKKILLPSVLKGSTLYIMDRKTKHRSVTVLDTKEFGFSNWKRYSAQIRKLPAQTILTDNPYIGTNETYLIANGPNIEKRRHPENGFYEDMLLSKIDIDGDGMPERIYECEEYEGRYYCIYSYIKGGWIKIYEGGYQGY